MYYKFLTDENQGEYSQFDFSQYLPKDGKPGKWMPKKTKLELCKKGYHVFERKDALTWLNSQLFEVEVKGKTVTSDDKIVCEQIRFVRKIESCNDRNLRLFACWCAEQYLPNYEKSYPNEAAPRKAVETARLFAEGKATVEELSAARSAAWSAAEAARSAAWSDQTIQFWKMLGE